MKEKIGNYEIVEEIGRTGVEIIYRARNTRTGKTVYLREVIFDPGIKPLVLKELIPDLGKRVANVKNLQHPNILTVLEEIKLGNRYFTVTKFTEGKTLRTILDEESPLPLSQATDWIKKLASALDYLQQKEIVLGKLHPENIQLDTGGDLRITDLGISIMLADIIEEKMVYKVDPVNYYAPEVVTGLRRAEMRSDLFTLGVLFYEMVTRQRPFEDKNRDLIISRIITEEPLPPRVHNPRISREIEAVILKALQKNPEQRYQTASEMLSDLQKIIEGHKYEAPPQEQAAIAQRARRAIRKDRFRRKTSRFLRKKSSWVIAAAIVVIGGGLFYFLGRPGPVPKYVTELTTPLEVIQLYYKGLQELDITILDQVTVERANRQATYMVATFRVAKGMLGELPRFELKNLQIAPLSSSPEELQFQATYLQKRYLEEEGEMKESWVETTDILKLKQVKNKWAIHTIETTLGSAFPIESPTPLPPTK